MTFRVGQRVACVDDEPHGRYTPWAHNNDMDGLRRRAIYTIRKIGFYNKSPCVWLEEISRSIPRGWEYLGEAGYHPNRFRPIVERKTDISALKALLEPVRERV